MFVVTGATGQTGRAAAETLLAKGQPVTVVVRDRNKGTEWEARGASVAVADLGDAAAMAEILKGAAGAYLMVPPTMTATDFLADRRKVSDALATAVQASGIERVVLLSSVGAHVASGTGPILTTRYSESVLGTVAPNLTSIRASYFLENWAGVLPVVVQNGVLPTFLTADRKIPMVATVDVGRVAAETLLDGVMGQRIIELGGPEFYSPVDIARVLSGLLGKPVQAQQVPLEAMPATLEGIGFTSNLARLYQEMVTGINEGRVAWEGREVRQGTVTAAEVLGKLLGQG